MELTELARFKIPAHEDYFDIGSRFILGNQMKRMFCYYDLDFFNLIGRLESPEPPRTLICSRVESYRSYLKDEAQDKKFRTFFHDAHCCLTQIASGETVIPDFSLTNDRLVFCVDFGGGLRPVFFLRRIMAQEKLRELDEWMLMMDPQRVHLKPGDIIFHI